MSKMGLLKLMVCSLCLGFVCCGSENFKAAVVDVRKADLITANKYTSLINEAAKSDVDVLVLPARKRVSLTSLEPCADDLQKFDEVVKSVSAAAKNAQVYVVAPLHEMVPCQDQEELVESNLVFDRTGALITVHRKSVTSATKCNATTTRVGRFTADFGVTFGVILEEDLILTNTQELEGIKNLIVTHSSAAKKSFLFAEQFPSSWAFANNVNVISADGKISAVSDISTTSSLLHVATLRKNGSEQQTLVVEPPTSFPSEDLSQYVTKPLNLEASLRGYRESVCHGKFCCQFYVKTSVMGTDPQDVSYGLVAFDGMQQLGSNNIALQTCSVVACAGLYKRSCCIGSKTNTTNIKFNEISISANFSKENSAQFPNILTTTQTVLDKDTLKFSDKNHNSVNAQLYNTENVLTFGIFGRDYSKDFESSQVNNDNGFLEFSEYISSENVQEFFDYVWIRLRVLIFIVSVYILEMM